MRKWKGLFALLAVALIAQAGVGQTQEDLQRRLVELEKRLNKVESENAEMRTQLVETDDEVLEKQVNALLDRYSAGTTVNSTANPVTLTGEFRFRTSWWVGDTTGSQFAVGNTRPDQEIQGSWSDARIRLGFQYDFTRDITAFAELQAHWSFGDSSSWTRGYNTSSPFAAPSGAEGSRGNGEGNASVQLYQGWIETRNILGRSELSSKTGRQEIVLGNQFQFGNADFYAGWVFDGSTWTWDSEAFSLTAIFARLSSGDLDGQQNPSISGSQFGSGRSYGHDDDFLYGVYFTLKTIKNVELDIYWIFMDGHGGAGSSTSGSSVGSLGDRVGAGVYGTTAYYHTIGGRIGGDFPNVAAGLDWNVEGAFQLGNIKGAGSGDIDAQGWTLEAEVGVTFNKDSMFRIFARFLFASGPSSGDAGYIPLYPNRHSNTGFRARYGLADLIPMSNVLTIQGGLHFDPGPAWTLGLTFLWATTDENGTITSTSNDDYGYELDIYADYRYSEQLTISVGLAFIKPDDEGEAYWQIDDDLAFYVYIQARLLF